MSARIPDGKAVAAGIRAVLMTRAMLLSNVVEAAGQAVTS